ncbi:AraC family transcriptional regulator [Achromobacter kerstersii]|uniref:AraC family transcriptional regulator n=1 Tax=Achromobacter kerstersii TaxID=1353890 RepID=UPI0006C3AC53|nr:AraC family transcriptional regulator [Achromobacter kerstersii]CUI73994.1 Urease operon transcriptional activator [Achromobacter kerstersii]
MAPYLASRGVSVLKFFQRFGISPDIFQNPDIWLPRATCFRIANEMATIANDPFGGAHVGHLTDLRSLGTWGNLVLCSKNIAQACAMAAAHAEMLHQGGNVRVITESRSIKLIHSFSGQLEENPLQFVLGSLAVLRKIPLMAKDASAIRVHLTAQRTRGDDALEASLGPNIVTGAKYDMVEFDRELLASPLRAIRDEASAITAALQSTIDTAGLLIAQIADQKTAKLVLIAKELGMSPRTIQRRLIRSGVDFQGLLDETRRSEALRLIGLGKYSTTDVAYMVGYSDQAHFTRAFKRWMGQVPSRFRFVTGNSL